MPYAVNLENYRVSTINKINGKFYFADQVRSVKSRSTFGQVGKSLLNLKYFFCTLIIFIL